MAKKIVIAVIVLVVIVVFAFVPLPIYGSTTISNTMMIARPPTDVFAYVTTPGNWPKWHPASKAVSGTTDHSLEVGEKVTEDFIVAGRTGRVVWTAMKREPPRQWIIEGTVDERQAGVITYTLTPMPEGTHFERVFVYPSPNLLFALANALSLRDQVKAESEQAVTNLKRVLEAAR